MLEIYRRKWEKPEKYPTKWEMGQKHERKWKMGEKHERKWEMGEKHERKWEMIEQERRKWVMIELLKIWEMVEKNEENGKWLGNIEENGNSLKKKTKKKGEKCRRKWETDEFGVIWVRTKK